MLYNVKTNYYMYTRYIITFNTCYWSYTCR